MYLTQTVLIKAYNGLKKISPQDTGKTRTEHLSGLRYFLAAEMQMKKNGADAVNLKVDTETRTEFQKYVGYVVAIGENGNYTKNFADEFDNAKDYKVGSNFLTTQVRRSRGGEAVYPNRPAPLVSLVDEILTTLDNANYTLTETYNIKRYNLELCLWLLREEKFGLEQDATSQQIFDAIIEEITIWFRKPVADLIAPNFSQFVNFLSNIDAPYLVETIADLSPLISPESNSLIDSDMSNTDILADEDPVMRFVRTAIDSKGELNFLFYGVPGTGKSWYAKRVASDLTDADPKRMKFLQFHPSASYDDFVEGFVPKISSAGVVTYSIKAKHFVSFANAAKSDPENKYVLVIDEITRGDPARVFGEMLTYIEPSHRGEEFSLIYSEKAFSIPENLIIIATANPHDRSVSELDDAFVRRFYMREFPADQELLKSWLADKNNVGDDDIKRIIHFFDLMNNSMPNGFGHAEFFNVYSLDDVRTLWTSKFRFLAHRALQYDPDKFSFLEEKFSNLFEQKEANSAQAIDVVDGQGER